MECVERPSNVSIMSSQLHGCLEGKVRFQLAPADYRLCQQVIFAAFLSVEGSEVVKLVSSHRALIHDVPTHFDRILTAMCVHQGQFFGMVLKSHSSGPRHVSLQSVVHS